MTWKNDGAGEYQKLARAALTELVEAEPLAAPEPDRQRVRSDAVAVRLTGETAALRERQAAEREEQA